MLRLYFIIPTEVYQILSDIIKGKFIASKDRDRVCKKAYTYFYKYCKCLLVKKVQHPVTSAKEEIIVFTNTATDTCSPAQIVLRAEEKAECIEFFLLSLKGRQCQKVKESISEKFCGITERDVQLFINKFENKAPLRPVTSLK